MNTANAPEILVSYDVYAFTVFVGNSYLDDQRDYLVGPATYMHVAGIVKSVMKGAVNIPHRRPAAGTKPIVTASPASIEDERVHQLCGHSATHHNVMSASETEKRCGG